MAGPTVDRSAARARAAAAWADLGDRLRTVTPRALARACLAAAVTVGVLVAAWATWPTLLPFALGGLIAYMLLPVVDTLDRFMPRALAAILAVLGIVAGLAAIAFLVLPPLATAFVALAAELPGTGDVDAIVNDLQTWLGTLPAGTAAIVGPVVLAVVKAVQDGLSGASGSLDDVVRAAVGALLNAVGALLGLIVLPAWMLTILTQQRRARPAIDQRLAPWLRDDFWAVMRIFDRATGSYLRGFVVVGFLVGLLVYIGIGVANRLGGPAFAQPLAVAAFAGVVQVIPEVGPILGVIPALLILPIAPDRAAVYLVIYIAARLIGATLLGSRLIERRLGVHPAIMVPSVVVLGQFGLLWLLLSAPIVAIVHDLVRYTHGRLTEPPRPAGLLPGEPAPRPAAARSAAAVPSVYRPATSPASYPPTGPASLTPTPR